MSFHFTSFFVVVVVVVVVNLVVSSKWRSLGSKHSHHGFVYVLFLMKPDTLCLITTMFVRPDANIYRDNV